MSIIAYPLEATEYTAEDVQSYLSTRTSGVYSEDITFTPEGMTVTVSPFLAWFNYARFKGCSVAVTEPETLTFSPAHAVLDRIDRIALRVDFTLNKAYFTVIEGTPSSSPVPPDISKTEVVNDISPAYVKIKAGATEITPADITSTILDESVCGIMRDGVTGIPTEQLQKQAMELLEILKSEIASVEDGSAYILKNGNSAMEADFNAGGFNITNVKNPTEPHHAASKAYVDSEALLITVVDQVNTSLNDYVEPGIYFFSSDYTPSDSPSGVNGWLFVLTDKRRKFIKQIWFRAGTPNSNDYSTKIRTSDGANWSNWQTVVVLLQKEVNGTTNSSGNISLNISSDFAINCLKVQDKIATPFFFGSSWRAHITSADTGAPLSNSSVTVTAYYTET